MTAVRETRAFVALGFKTTHAALSAESLLEDLGITVTPIPAPRVLGALCGIALRLELADVERAEELLARGDIAVTGRVEIEDV